MKVLIAIDCQVDFLTGALANPEAQKKIPNIVEKIKTERENGSFIIFTKDTHKENYMDTLEGKYLPIPHCINGTEGWDLAPEIKPEFKNGDMVVCKPTFGSEDLINIMKMEKCVEIELIGFCTDICVVSNALMLRAALPNTKISVDANCCAGTTVENHESALRVMRSCQIDIKNWEE